MGYEKYFAVYRHGQSEYKSIEIDNPASTTPTARPMHEGVHNSLLDDPQCVFWPWLSVPNL